jgi:hypothetical protein
MKKLILVYGCIAGAIVSLLMLAGMMLMTNGLVNFDNGVVIGYASMVIAFVTIVVAIKIYRDEHQQGVITFVQALKIGLAITLIASLLYAITWEVYYNSSAQDFMDRYSSHYIGKLKDEGASEEEIKKAMVKMEEIKDLYKQPVVRFALTLSEILPVGIVITLVSSFAFRKKKVATS